MPAYADMIKEAITTLKERGGSSLPAIKKYLIANHGCDFTKGADKSHLLRALKNGEAKGLLSKNKASYKVIKQPEPKKKKPKAKKKKKSGGGGGGITAQKQLSEELAAVCGFDSGSRGDVIKGVWAYIKSNGLKGDSGIKCDAAMKKVFGKSTLANTDIMGGISPHLS